MRWPTALTLILAAQAAATAGFLLAVRGKAFPLGVPGEWEWLRTPYGPEPVSFILAGAGVAAYAGFAGLVGRALASKATAWREALAVVTLAAVASGVQFAAQGGAPDGYGLEKWVVALHHRGSSGYFAVARAEARDLPKFLRDYPRWVQTQDALHLGTHPPGLIAAEAMLLRVLETHPYASRRALDLAPNSVLRMLRVYGQDNALSGPDRAALVVTGMVTLLACASAVAPLYVLARASLPPASAWGAAALWPLAPSAVLFQPAADAAFAFVSATALALAAHAMRGSARRAAWIGAACGVVLGVGMQFTLAFLAVGLVAGLMLVFTPGLLRSSRVAGIFATGAGFLAVTFALWAATGADPFVTWWRNQANHARFYREFPRSYRAWVPENPVELGVGLGIPAACWAVVGLSRRRGAPAAAAATLAVLAALTLGGRNLSEVGRLWLPFMPALLVAAGEGLKRCRAGPTALAATVLLGGAQTLALQAMIQVVYPV